MADLSSTELVEFLRARLDEDEQAAQDATPGPWWEDTPASRWGDTPDAEVTATTGPVAKLPISERGTLNALHIARHDPARVLPEVEAKRRILARIQHHANLMGRDEIHGDLLRLIALPYADHPDYRGEWRP